MFDIRKVAQKIREARIAQNMTQMNLADAMEVSYQAVSNWERGNSCPDISKLEQLCNILHIGMEELMGMESTAKTVNWIIDRGNRDRLFPDGGRREFSGEPEGAGVGREGSMEQNREITARELEELAPILPPDDVKQLAKDISKISYEELMGLAPFLSREAVDRLAERCESEIEIGELTGLAAFLSRGAADRLAEKCQGEIHVGELTGLAPFLSREAVDRLAERCEGEIEIGELIGLAAFLSRGAADRLAEKCQGEIDICELTGLAPFLSRSCVSNLAARHCETVSMEELMGLAPFMDQDALSKMVLSIKKAL